MTHHFSKQLTEGSAVTCVKLCKASTYINITDRTNVLFVLVQSVIQDLKVFRRRHMTKIGHVMIERERERQTDRQTDRQMDREWHFWFDQKPCILEQMLLLGFFQSEECLAFVLSFTCIICKYTYFSFVSSIRA